MFHRVKSETAVQEREEKLVDEKSEAQEKAENAMQRAQKSTTISQQQPAETSDVAVDMQEQEESEPAEETRQSQQSFSPAQSLYQRPAAPQQQPASPAARAQAYASRPTYAAPAAPKRAPAQSSETAENDRRLTIGRGITMSGEIECCDELQVEGTVEAALKGAKFLNIAESGVFYGTVEIEDAVIAGRFEGEIVVNGCLTIEETGVITGSISYKELEIKSGAIVDGRVTPLNAQAKNKASNAPLFDDAE